MPREAPASLVDEDLGIDDLLELDRLEPRRLVAQPSPRLSSSLPPLVLDVHVADALLVATLFALAAAAAGVVLFVRWQRRGAVYARVREALSRAEALEDELVVDGDRHHRTWSDRDPSPEEDSMAAVKLGKALSAAVEALQADALVHDAWTAAAGEVGDGLSSDLERASSLRDSLASAGRFLAALLSFWGKVAERGEEDFDEGDTDGGPEDSHGFLALSAAYRELPRHLRRGRALDIARLAEGGLGETGAEADAIASGSPPPSPVRRFRKGRAADVSGSRRKRRTYSSSSSRTTTTISSRISSSSHAPPTLLTRMYERAAARVAEDWNALERAAGTGFRDLGGGTEAGEQKIGIGDASSRPSSLARYRGRLAAIASIGDASPGVASPERSQMLTVKSEPATGMRDENKGMGESYGYDYRRVNAAAGNAAAAAATGAAGAAGASGATSAAADGSGPGAETAAGHTPTRLLRAEVDAAVASLGVSRQDAALEVLRADLNHRSRASVSLAAAAAAAAVARRSDQALLAAAREMRAAFWARADARAAAAARKRSRRRRRRRGRKAAVLASMRRRAWGEWFRAAQVLSVGAALALSLALVFATGGEFSSSASLSFFSFQRQHDQQQRQRLTTTMSSWLSPIADAAASLRVAVLTGAAIVAAAAAGHLLGRSAALSVAAAAAVAAHAAELTAAARRSWALLALFAAHEAATFLLLHSDLLGIEEWQRRRQGRREGTNRSVAMAEASRSGRGGAASTTTSLDLDSGSDDSDYESVGSATTRTQRGAPTRATSRRHSSSHSVALAIMLMYAAASAALAVLAASFVGCGAERGGECAEALAASARTVFDFFRWS